MSAAQTLTALAESARETEQYEREHLEQESSFVTAMSPSSVFSNTSPRLSPVVAVEGRVFRRLQRFHLLPSELKAQSDMVATYLLAPKVRFHVFEQRKHWWQHPLHLAKAGQGTFIQGRKLIKAILRYLVLSNAADNTLRDAQQLAEGLVLSGFLSPVDETPEADDELLEELYIMDDDYYELVAPGATAIVSILYVAASATVDSNSTNPLPGAIVLPVQPHQSPTSRKKQSRQSNDTLSVWAVTDGAICAGFVQRQHKGSYVRNVLGIATKSKFCYAVVNMKHHLLVLFETDVARRELIRVDLTASTVEYSGVNALKVCDCGGDRIGIHSNNDAVEILIFQNKPKQEQWLLALLNAGAAFIETHLAILSFAASSASLYSLQDKDAVGNTVSFCQRRYEDAGLKVVAFPSAQFGDAEFDNDQELVERFGDLFGVRFSVLATRDVNGPNARDAMIFCKTRQPGPAKSAANAFIENNFVKFLFDREGRLFKRYPPSYLPLSMETDIHTLLTAPSPSKSDLNPT
ncbi:unnamed protein product [Peronospora destructor]|uniref:Uncharacterized protein n=1 Tax=Peronospora destructor TaxID=86335 RepID=A0AAV0T0J2_9STRA|nr:unnamed protein product [Peronospora destructor]